MGPLARTTSESKATRPPTENSPIITSTAPTPSETTCVNVMLNSAVDAVSEPRNDILVVLRASIRRPALVIE